MQYFDMFNKVNKADYLFPVFTLLTSWYHRPFGYIIFPNSEVPLYLCLTSILILNQYLYMHLKMKLIAS